MKRTKVRTGIYKDDYGFCAVAFAHGFEPARDDQLAKLTHGVARRRQVQVLGQLLGNRAAALDDAPRPEIDPGGAPQADEVDAIMLVEAPVLRGGRRRRAQGAAARLGDSDAFAVANACRTASSSPSSHPPTSPPSSAAARCRAARW